MNNILKVAFAAALVALPLQVQATAITILNPGFEDPATNFVAKPITDWTDTGGGAGVWNINANGAPYWTAPAPEGNQIGFLSDAPSPGSPASISQVLSDSLAANTLYTLSGQVGHPIGYEVGTIWTASLYAYDGSTHTLLDSISGTGPAGSFIGFSLIFDSTGSSYVGDFLEIQLASNQAQTGFDQIALDAQSVPEGGATTLALLGIGLASLAAFREKAFGLSKVSGA
jgi:HpiC1 cyclase